MEAESMRGPRYIVVMPVGRMKMEMKKASQLSADIGL
jgi:hypothetical protein